MAINDSSRKVRLTIGSQDFSQSLLEISRWQTSPLDQSGLIKTSATIVLIYTEDLLLSGTPPSVLDDRANPGTWYVGQQITIDVLNSSGTYQRHPVGFLRLMSCVYEPAELKLTIEAACLITALSFKEPTTPTYANITPGTFRQRNLIITDLLKLVGIYNINCPYTLKYPINYPIQLQGSYLETVGRLLYSAGMLAWIDGAETFTIQPVDLTGLTAVSWQIGGDAGDEKWYKRLSSSEGPREIIRVTGVTQVQKNFVTTDDNIKYGNASSVDPSLTGLVVMAEAKTNIVWDQAAATLTTTVDTTSPIGLNLAEPAYPFSFPGAKLQQIKSESDIETRVYETSVSGKLLQVNKITYKLVGAALSEYCTTLAELPGNQKVIVNGQDQLFLAETSASTYVYDQYQRLTKITTFKYESQGALLAGTSFDWTTMTSIPTGLAISEVTEEDFLELGKTNWKHTSTSYKCKSRVNPSAASLIVNDPNAPPGTPPVDLIGGRLALILDPNSTYIDNSNSGQTVPPAPERRLPDSEFVSRQIRGDCQFAQIGGNPYIDRMRVYQIEYLQGETAAQDDLSIPTVPDFQDPNVYVIGGPAVLQCQALAKLEGQLLFGRFKGQDIGVDFKDPLFGWHPLWGINVTEPDGTGRVFQTDDAHWLVNNEMAIANFGCIWIGNNVPSTATLPNGTTTTLPSTTTAIVVTLTQAVNTGDTVIYLQPLSGYLPQYAALDFNGTTLLTAAPAYPGDTVIQISPAP